MHVERATVVCTSLIIKVFCPGIFCIGVAMHVMGYVQPRPTSKKPKTMACQRTSTVFSQIQRASTLACCCMINN